VNSLIKLRLNAGLFSHSIKLRGLLEYVCTHLQILGLFLTY